MDNRPWHKLTWNLGELISKNSVEGGDPHKKI